MTESEHTEPSPPPVVSDPALELHRLLLSWTADKNVSIMQARGIQTTEPDGWAPIERAAKLIGEIRLGLSVLSALGIDSSKYERQMPEWLGAVFSVQYPWNDTTQGRRAALGAGGALDMLEALSDQFRLVGYPGAVRPNEVETIRDGVNDVRTLIATFADDRVTNQARALLLALCEQLERALREVGECGMISVRRLAAELYGLLVEFGEALPADSDARKTWDESVGKFSRKLLTWVPLTMAGGIVSQLGVVAMHAITSGLGG